MKRLPDAEFEIMKIVWQLPEPVTSGMLMEILSEKDKKEWKCQTIHTLLGRLVERGFLRTEKKGKERTFFSLVERDEYLQFETQSFVKQYYEGSKLNLLNALYEGKQLHSDDIEELAQWIDERRKGK